MDQLLPYSKGFVWISKPKHYSQQCLIGVSLVTLKTQIEDRFRTRNGVGEQMDSEDRFKTKDSTFKPKSLRNTANRNKLIEPKINTERAQNKHIDNKKNSFKFSYFNRINDINGN
ncbi:unnamed protein product [Lepeophtheirus salmonis]|uniref:(salmon louse) hypothetical protein n=1 Tax=Lepeophtheirus salmonis TaxID=72036 RepID=A0A7R8H1F7_LEPSM|nr:unnamed protein product [Lepeophtheirus salmonis]CAF2810617.1 unnamed protein product [Lepeophtheirus salmonis]